MKQNNKHSLAQRGFTLLEILIVLGIIGVIAAIVAGNVAGQADKANVDIAATQIAKIEGAVVNFRQHTKRLPNNLDELVTQPSGVKHWVGPYVKEEQLMDPWGTKLQYRKPGQHGRYDIFSLGADGKAGGSGVDADVGNW